MCKVESSIKIIICHSFLKDWEKRPETIKLNDAVAFSVIYKNKYIKRLNRATMRYKSKQVFLWRFVLKTLAIILSFRITESLVLQALQSLTKKATFVIKNTLFGTAQTNWSNFFLVLLVI